MWCFWQSVLLYHRLVHNCTWKEFIINQKKLCEVQEVCFESYPHVEGRIFSMHWVMLKDTNTSDKMRILLIFKECVCFLGLLYVLATNKFSKKFSDLSQSEWARLEKGNKQKQSGVPPLGNCVEGSARWLAQRIGMIFKTLLLQFYHRCQKGSMNCLFPYNKPNFLFERTLRHSQRCSLITKVSSLIWKCSVLDWKVFSLAERWYTSRLV